MCYAGGMLTPASKVVLYTYWRSSSSYRVRLALGYKRVAFESVFVNLLEGAQLRPEYKENNPAGWLPCLVVDGEPFTESVAILELLDDLVPAPPLYPRDPVHRARVRALVETVNSGTQPLQNTSVLARVSDDPAARAAWGAHFNARGLATLEALIARYRSPGSAGGGVKGPFAYGETFGAADACLVPQVYSARRFKVDLAPYPLVVAAEQAALALPELRAALPENQGDAVP